MRRLLVTGSFLALSLLMVSCNIGYVPTTLPSPPKTPLSPTTPTPTPNPPPPAVSTSAPVNKPTQVNKIAEVETIGANSLYPRLDVQLKPTTSALAGKVYSVDLVEKGNIRATTTVRWNQPEINVLKSKTVSFPLSSVEYSAYKGANISTIFATNIRDFISKIVFASDHREGNLDIYTMTMNGSTQSRITYYNGADIDPVWSPDGTKIVLSSERAGQADIYVMDEVGMNPVRLTTAGGRQPTWSPDGTRIAFISERDNTKPGIFQIYVMNNDGSNQKRITQTYSNFNPAWSPDGNSIAFTRDLTDYSRGSGPVIMEIYVMNVDGSNQVKLTNVGGMNEAPAWSPDGAKIAFTSNRNTNGNNNQKIFVMDKNGGNQSLLVTSTNEDFSPTWTADGNKIVFVSTRTGFREIYIMNADGSNQTPLTKRTTGGDNHPNCWVP